MSWAIAGDWLAVAGLILLTFGTGAQAWANLAEFRSMRRHGLGGRFECDDRRACNWARCPLCPVAGKTIRAAAATATASGKAIVGLLSWRCVSCSFGHPWPR